MKKTVFILFLVIIPFLLCNTVHAEKYEFTYPNEGFVSESELSNLYDALPEDINSEIVKITPDNSYELCERYDLNFFIYQITAAVKNSIEPTLNILSKLIAVIIVSSLFNHVSSSLVKHKFDSVFRLCTSLCLVLSLQSIHYSIFEIASGLLKTLSNTMLLIVPVIEGIYVSSGNLSLAAVTTAAISLMISVVETVYSQILGPAVSASFILSSVSCITQNSAVAFISKTLRGFVCGSIVAVMSLMSIILNMQSGIASASDTFATKAIRFALGNYIPLIGGSVSESLSVVNGSIGIIKQGAGITGIIVLFLLILPPLAMLLMARLAIAAAKTAAEILSCDSEKNILSEFGSIYTMMICITISASILFIYAISQFCKTPLAFN